MGLFHRAQFLMSVLLQSGSCLDLRSCQTTCFSVGSPLGYSVSAMSQFLYRLSTSYSFLQATCTHSNTVLPELQGDTLCNHGLQGAWSTNSTSFFSDFGVYRAVFHTFFTYLSFSQLLHSVFLPFFKCVIVGATPV